MFYLISTKLFKTYLWDQTGLTIKNETSTIALNSFSLSLFFHIKVPALMHHQLLFKIFSHTRLSIIVWCRFLLVKWFDADSCQSNSLMQIPVNQIVWWRISEISWFLAFLFFWPFVVRAWGAITHKNLNMITFFFFLFLKVLLDFDENVKQKKLKVKKIKNNRKICCF